MIFSKQLTQVQCPIEMCEAPSPVHGRQQQHTLVCAATLQVIDAGANAIVAGSAVFKAKSYRDGEPVSSRCFCIPAGVGPSSSCLCAPVCTPLHVVITLCGAHDAASGI